MGRWRFPRRDRAAARPAASEADRHGRHAAAVAAETVQAAMRLLPYTLITVAFVCPINIFLSSSGIDHRLAVILAALHEAIAAFGIGYCLLRARTRRRHPPAPGADLQVDRRVVILVAAAIGITWFWMPVLLFPSASATGRLMIACTCAGVICTSLALIPIAAAQRALAVPLIAGSFVALAMTRDPRLVALGVLLAIYGAFITGAAWQLGLLVSRSTLARLQLLEQNSTVQLLLGHAETEGGSLLWETGPNGAMRYVSHELADALGVRRQRLESLRLSALIAPLPPGPADASGSGAGEAADERHHLLRCLANRVAFRNLAVQVRPPPDRDASGGQAAWPGGVPPVSTWSFTGKPVFEAGGVFVGFRGVVTDITEIREAERRASYRARHDPLTGLMNRHAFSDQLRQALHAYGRSGTPFAVLCFDLDGFKVVNDRYGHAAGDGLIRAVAARLGAACGAGVQLARQGGDEFIGLVANADVGVVDRLTRDVLGAIGRPFGIDGEEISIGISIGAALAPVAGDSGDVLVEAADLALYQAKRDGGGVMRFYEPRLRQVAQERRDLLADLRRAVERRDFTLVYQPIVDTQTLSLRGFETLLRWNRPGYGAVPPDRFIRVAEEAGLIGELGMWVMEEACRTAAAWPERLRVAVNVSVSQLETPGFAGQLAGVLSRTGLAATRLELEITESIFMDSDASSFGVLDSLRELGAHIALDDFGNGFSSLSFLRGFTFSKIKMDKDFVRDMTLDRRANAVVSAIVNLGAELGIVVTAEGVETPAQLAVLRQMGCTEAQGFLFSRPVASDALDALVRQIGFEPGDAAASDVAVPGYALPPASDGDAPFAA